jgi:hypothetical protein
VQDPEYFTIGTVFAAQVPRPTREENSEWSVRGSRGQWYFDKVRSYVVVKRRRKHCTVVPIDSYSGQGVLKPGVKKSDHAIIHTSPVAPLPLEGECRSTLHRRGSSLRSKAVRVDSDHNVDGTNVLDLTPESRIDYATFFDIDFYVRVKPLGRIHPDSMIDHRDHIALTWGAPTSANAQEPGHSQHRSTHGTEVGDTLFVSSRSDDGTVAQNLSASSNTYKIISGTPGFEEPSDSRALH